MVYLLISSRREVVIKHLNQPFTYFQSKPFRAQSNFTVTSLSAFFQSSSCIMNEANPLYSTSIFTCVVNAFSAYTAIMLNILTIHAMRKTSSFWSWCWFTGSTFIHYKGSKSYLFRLSLHISGPTHTCLCLILQCCGYKCRQIIGYSSSSQISGTCDSQASRCSCDLNLDIESSFSAINFVFELQNACFRGYGSYFRVFFHYVGNCLFQNLFHCKPSRKPNSSPSNTSSTE